MEHAVYRNQYLAMNIQNFIASDMTSLDQGYQQTLDTGT